MRSAASAVFLALLAGGLAQAADLRFDFTGAADGAVPVRCDTPPHYDATPAAAWTTAASCSRASR